MSLIPVEIKKTSQICIVIGGKEYFMCRPKLGAALDLEEKLDEAKAAGKGGTRIVMNFIVKCGLPEEVCLELDTEELEQVLGVLTPSKKS